MAGPHGRLRQHRAGDAVLRAGARQGRKLLAGDVLSRPHRAAIVGIAGASLSAAEAAAFAATPPAGVILFARNVVGRSQVAALTAEVRATVPGVVVMVDQEGGRVARLRPPEFAVHPPAATIGALYQRDPAAGLRAAWLTGAAIGAECAALGIDVVAAPVLDLACPGAHEVIGDRAYAAEPDAVAALGGAMAEGLVAAGVQPAMKHVPGHGRAAADSHLSLPVVDAPAETLLREAAPFAAVGAVAGWAMTAHVLYPAWDAGRPATVSPTIIAGIVRGALGFSGVLVSDDLAMHALRGTPGERASAAVAAGCDLALHCSGILAETIDVLASVGPARAWPLPPRPVLVGDVAALVAERRRLLA